MDSETQTPEPDRPEPLTDRQRAFAAALPDAERREFEIMSSTDRDELLDVMRWAGQPGVEVAAAAYDQARLELETLRARTARAGCYWPRNPLTAPSTRAELDALDRLDNEAVDAALALLDALLRQASRHKGLARRSRQLARIDRALADPQTGYLRRLREERTRTLNDRYSAGAPVEVLAAEAGVSTRRIKQLLAGANVTHMSPEMQAMKDQLAAQRAARAAQTRARKEAQKQADLAQGRAWAARVIAGERVTAIAAQEGVAWQLVANRIRAARRVQTAAEAA